MTATEPSVSIDSKLEAKEVTRRGHLDGDNESVSETVVRAVGEALGKKVTEVEPLNGTVDPDALNALFDVRMNGETRSGDGGAFFRLDGCDVTVYSDGRVVVRR